MKLPKLPNVAELRKAAVAAAGLVGQVLALGLLTGTPEHVAQAVLAAATALGVYVVPNGKPAAPAVPVVPQA